MLSWIEKQLCNNDDNDRPRNWVFYMPMVESYKDLIFLLDKALSNTMQAVLPISNYYQYFCI